MNRGSEEIDDIYLYFGTYPRSRHKKEHFEKKSSCCLFYFTGERMRIG